MILDPSPFTDSVASPVEALLLKRPAGVTVEDVAEGLGVTLDTAKLIVADEMAADRLERWPFWPGRLRATAQAGSAYLAGVARLRRLARPSLADIHRLSKTPVTLHLLVPEGQQVVDRYPTVGQPDEAAYERKTYASARPLSEGSTAFAFRAFMGIAALDPPEGDEIRARGYCLREGRKTVGSWVLSCPIRDPADTPYAVFCAFGMQDQVPLSHARSAAAAIAEAAHRFAGHSQVEPVVARSRAIIKGLRDQFEELDT